MPIHDYSTIPASNTALFPEGMLAPALNDGMRQVQADLRSWYNDPTWLRYGDGDGGFQINWVSGTQLAIVGVDVTAVYHAGRRVKVTGPITGTVYGTITDSVFAVDTTITLELDSGTIANESFAVYLSALAGDGNALPRNSIQSLRLDRDDAVAGPELILDRVSADPAALDVLGIVRLRGRDSADATIQYGSIFGRIGDPTAGTAKGYIGFNTRSGGVATDRFFIGEGLHAEGLVDDGPGTGHFLTQLRVTSLDSGAVGAPVLATYRDSISPAAEDDMGIVEWLGRNSAAESVGYGRIAAVLTDPADGAESARLVAWAMQDGVLTEVARFGPHVRIGVPLDPEGVTLEQGDLLADRIFCDDIQMRTGKLFFVDNIGARDVMHFRNDATADDYVVRIGADGKLNIYSETNAGGSRKLQLGSGLVLGTPSGGDRGLGTLNATAVFDDNALLTCYALEAAIDGRVNLPAWDRLAPDGRHQGARRFIGRELRDLDPAWYAAFWKERGHLPALPSRDAWARKGAFSTGDLVQRLWETVEVQAVHIERLLARVEQIERRAL